jgi:hypothetical protein
MRTIAAPLVEAGDWGADLIRRYRFKSAVKTYALAKKMLDEAGIDPERVPLHILVPLIEKASLAEDPDESDDPVAAEAMKERWAALLANAAAGSQSAEVLPSFPQILSELSPEEAAILDDIYRPVDDPIRDWRAYQLHPDIFAARRAADPLFDTRCFNLERLRLVENQMENLRMPGTDPPVYRTLSQFVSGTGLGWNFVLACTRPRAGSWAGLPD